MTWTRRVADHIWRPIRNLSWAMLLWSLACWILAAWIPFFEGLGGRFFITSTCLWWMSFFILVWSKTTP